MTGGRGASLSAPFITAQGVRKAYGAGDTRNEVLRGVDLRVEEGVLAMLVGPSGCGKSTLLNLLGGLDAPDHGRLVVAGVDLSQVNDAARARFRRCHAAFIFQHYQLVPTLTAAENVEVVLEHTGLDGREITHRAAEALDEVGLADKSGRFPSQLSGGEQQRVAIARALAKRPRLVLADEPTGSLDREGAARILDLLRARQRAHGTTMVVVTHDQAVMRAGDVVFALQDGVLSTGTP